MAQENPKETFDHFQNDTDILEIFHKYNTFKLRTVFKPKYSYALSTVSMWMPYHINLSHYMVVIH